VGADLERGVAWFFRLLDAYDPGRLGAAWPQNQPPEPVRRSTHSHRRLAVRTGRKRRTIAATVATAVMGGALLLGAGSASAGEIVVVRLLGRKAAVVKTASAAWATSVQGEFVDDNYVTKPDPNALRGRAAVKETRGVARIRISEVELQQLQSNGTWKMIKERTEDVVKQQTTAYAVAYTPTVRVCWMEEEGRTMRTYRVVSSYGIRQTSGTATNRTLTSSTFRAPTLASDPACPRGAFNVRLSGPDELQLGESREVGFTSNFVSLDDKPVQSVTVVVNFENSLDVELLEGDGLAVNESSPDPNDYFLEGATWPSGNEEQVDALFMVTPTELGRAISGGSVLTTDPKVYAEDSTWETEVVEATDADLALQASLPEQFDLNTDVDPDAPGLQLHPGDQLTYSFAVRNDGPATATGIIISAGWSSSATTGIERAWYAGDMDGDPVDCSVDEYSQFVCHIADMAPGEANTILVQTHLIDEIPVPNVIENSAHLVLDQNDPDNGNEEGYFTFDVVEKPPAE
jgi:hypothetical protein